MKEEHSWSNSHPAVILPVPTNILAADEADDLRRFLTTRPLTSYMRNSTCDACPVSSRKATALVNGFGSARDM